MNVTEIKTGRVLLDFYADWCAPCKTLSKQLEQYQQEVSEVKVVKINIDEEQEMSMAFGVRSIPTLFYMENGEVVDRTSGVKSIDELKQFTKSE